MADVVPIPKVKPVMDISKHLRPISLTPVLSKVVEDFVVGLYVSPAMMDAMMGVIVIVWRNSEIVYPSHPNIHGAQLDQCNWQYRSCCEGCPFRL